MRRWLFKYLLLGCLIVIFAASLAVGANKGFTFISKDQLRQMLTKPDLTLIDVRTDHDWASSHWKIKRAQRRVPEQVQEWMGQYPKDKTIILYCA